MNPVSERPATPPAPADNTPLGRWAAVFTQAALASLQQHGFAINELIRRADAAPTPVGANLVWAGPTTGGAVAPVFRSLVSADIPATLDGVRTFNAVLEVKSAVWDQVRCGVSLTRRGRVGSDGAKAGLTWNTSWNGAAWVQDDVTAQSFATITDNGTGQWEWWHTPAGGVPALRLRLTSTGVLRVVNGLISDGPTGKVGYGGGTGAAGVVTQLTNKTTAVTLDKPTGLITMAATALAANTAVAFTVNNTVTAATDVAVVNVVSPTGGFFYTADIVSIVAGSFIVAVRNETAASRSEAVQLRFALFRSANN